jgi:hypothetical protein
LGRRHGSPPAAWKIGNLLLTIPIVWQDVYNMRMMRSRVVRINLYSLYFCFYTVPCDDFVRRCCNFPVIGDNLVATGKKINHIVVFVVVCFRPILMRWSTHIGLGKMPGLFSSDCCGQLHHLVLIAHFLTCSGWVCTLGICDLWYWLLFDTLPFPFFAKLTGHGSYH